jgi:hypothetical protein
VTATAKVELAGRFCAGDSRKLKTWKPQCLLVACQGAGTTRCRAKRSDGIGERALSLLECNPIRFETGLPEGAIDHFVSHDVTSRTAWQVLVVHGKVSVNQLSCAAAEG